MRIPTRRLGAVLMGLGLSLGVICQRGWGQLGEQPARPAAPQLPSAGTTNPSLPAPRLLPPPSSPLPEIPEGSLPPPSGIETNHQRLPQPLDTLPPPRFDPPAVAMPLSATDTPSAPKQDPAVSVAWVGETTARLNRPLACQIVVRNRGQAAVHSVLVRHGLAPGTTCTHTDPPAATERDELIWTVGTLQPGQERRLELHIVAGQRGTMNCQATVSFASAVSQQVQVREPLLHVKMRLPEKAVAGDTVNILCSVTNPGDGVAELVKVKARLPDGLENPRGQTLEIDIGNLGPKETRTVQIPCIAKASGSHTCRVRVTGDGGLSATDRADTEILEAKLNVAVAGPKLRYLDRHATYTLKVSNPGNAPAGNVMLHEAVPAGFKFHTANASGQWDAATKTVSWQLGDLQPGQSREVTVELIAAAAGEHRLQAQVASNRGVRSEASAVTRIEASSSLVIELADLEDPVEVGGETTYEIRIANAGTKLETNVELSCTLPDQVEFRSAKSVTGLSHRVTGREVVFDPLPRLAPKADVIYRVTVRGLQAGDVRFRARIRADGMPEPVLREESTRFYNDK
jgi:uncharacterized repeat protein (TIGR01451 family)